MGYFNGIAESAFKENPDGEGWLYYPNGILSKGHIVTDPSYKEKLFKFQKRMYMFLIPFSILYGLSLDLENLELASLYPLVIIMMPVYLRQYFLVRKLPKSEVKLKFKEGIETASKKLPKSYFYFLYISAAVLIALGLSTPLLFDKPYSEVKDLVLMLSGMGLFFFVVTIFLQKLKNS